MQTGDITKQWIPENCGKFNRGVGESRNSVFILSIIIILIVMSAISITPAGRDSYYRTF